MGWVCLRGVLTRAHACEHLNRLDCVCVWVHVRVCACACLWGPLSKARAGLGVCGGSSLEEQLTAHPPRPAHPRNLSAPTHKLSHQLTAVLQCYRLWERVKSEPRWTPQWGQLAMAAADNAALCLEHYCDTIAGWVC